MPEVAVPRDIEARFAQNEERGAGTDRRLSSLEAATAQGFAQLTTQINSLASEFRAAQKTPWAVVWAAASVVVVVIGGLFWTVYAPLNARVDELKIASGEATKIAAATQLETARQFASLPKDYLTNDVAEILRTRAKEDRDNAAAALREKVNRDDWVLRNDTVDRLIAALESRIAANTAAISTVNGGLPDLIHDLKARIERLEESKP